MPSSSESGPQHEQVGLTQYGILYRSDGVSASQDGVKCSFSRDHGSEVHFDTLPSDQPGTPPLHNDAFPASDTLEEGGVCCLQAWPYV